MTPQAQPGNGTAVHGVPPAFGGPRPVLMGYREYARHREAQGLSGSSLTAVQKAIANGRIQTVEVDGKKLIDRDRADRDWEAHTEARNGNQPAVAQRAIPGTEQFQRPAPETAAAAPEDGSYAGARAKREIAQARLAELELGEKEGALVNRAAVEREMMACGRRLKQSLENIPAQIAPLLAAVSEEHEVHRILRAEIRKVLEGLADSLGAAVEAEAA